MRNIYRTSIVLITLSYLFSCTNNNYEPQHQMANNYASFVSQEAKAIIPGAERIGLYYKMLEGKRVGLIVNQSSMVGKTHLLDTLLEIGIDVGRIFSPEHGFRGTADNGEKVGDSAIENIPIISLYGKNRKPTEDQFSDLDMIVFDLQDVGVRFYTYISTLHYVMQTCAEVDIPLMILDRPNPNGYYIDGPVLDEAYRSFVGMHQVPLVYGMTIGEYGTMVNGEHWHHPSIAVDLTVVPCKNYDHTMSYDLPIPPSPNLPNHRSVILYPSLALFEGTVVSIGRGTDKPFQHVGHPSYSDKQYSFVPKPGYGSKSPKLNGSKCYGMDLADKSSWYYKESGKLDLSYLLKFYHDLRLGEEFFLENKFIDKLTGTDKLRMQVEEGKTEEEIRSSWQEDLEEFKKLRKQYLIYPDFE